MRDSTKTRRWRGAAGPDGGEWFARDENGNLSYGEFGWWVSGPAVETEDSEWGQAVADHIARHDPPRVLREVESKRRIVDNSELARIALDSVPMGDRVSSSDDALSSYWRGQHFVLRVLAAAYSDHPDYREEWAL